METLPFPTQSNTFFAPMFKAAIMSPAAIVIETSI